MTELYFERSMLTSNGLWKVQGGAAIDPAFGHASSLYQLKCATANDGVVARVYVQLRHRDPYGSHPVDLSVDSEFNISNETIVLG